MYVRNSKRLASLLLLITFGYFIRFSRDSAALKGIRRSLWLAGGEWAGGGGRHFVQFTAMQIHVCRLNGTLPK